MHLLSYIHVTLLLDFPVSISLLPYQTHPLGLTRKHGIPTIYRGFPGGSDSKESAVWEAQVQSLGWADPVEKEMETHSSILAWEIP